VVKTDQVQFGWRSISVPLLKKEGVNLTGSDSTQFTCDPLKPVSSRAMVN